MLLQVLLSLLLFSSTVDFSGTWQFQSRELQIRESGNLLLVKTTTKRADGPHSLDLRYQIGGPELVYTGLDGDEFHTKVKRDGDRLIFQTVEHERGTLIPSRQTWTLIDNGQVVRQERESKKDGKVKASVQLYNRAHR